MTHSGGHGEGLGNAGETERERRGIPAALMQWRLSKPCFINMEEVE